MNSLEEFLASLPKPGEKVKFIKTPEWHWFKNVIFNCELLEVGGIYEVDSCDAFSSWTRVTLREFGSEIWFSWNSFGKVS